MKTPDKIYIAETPNKLIEIWSDEPIELKPYITEHEYIRKDILLEWLKPEKDISFPDDYERGCVDGRNGLRGELIDKLNSM